MRVQPLQALQTDEWQKVAVLATVLSGWTSEPASELPVLDRARPSLGSTMRRQGMLTLTLCALCMRPKFKRV